MSIRFSLLSAKNPIERLSGDQNGCWAPSVPVNARTVPESSARTHMRDRALSVATNASVRPSGEIAIDVGTVDGGVVTSSRTWGADVVRRVAQPIAIAAAATMTAANS